MEKKKNKKQSKVPAGSAKIKLAYLKEVDKIGDIKVWIVDGSYIRTHIDEEFTNFGQHYSFSYIPKNEFWIDQEAKDDERRFFIDHLLVEHRLTAPKGLFDLS